jgi:bromodomain-containing factor 1
MDFGTIRSKLDANLYTEGPSEFLNDVSLTFENCLKYNGEDSGISKICKGVREEFNKSFVQLNFEFYL